MFVKPYAQPICLYHLWFENDEFDDLWRHVGINIHPNLVAIHLHKKLESWDFGNTNVEEV